ncbi:Protein KES1 [Leucoagaricus sp. SymC.cos]|nr:Protein KES1 [Leucoagaricus sp. SymC.cos]
MPISQHGSWSSFLRLCIFLSDTSRLSPLIAYFCRSIVQERFLFWESFCPSSEVPGRLLSTIALLLVLSDETLAYCCRRSDLFAVIADAKVNKARALAVLCWFTSTLKDQYASRNESMGSGRKPLNPVLGELLYGYWPDQNNRGRTTLLVEQVSHHPPITAYVIENKSKGLKLVGHNAQKISFSSGSIIVRQIGHATLTIGDTKYLITLPKLRINGLWYGSPYIELTDTLYIVGGGFLSTIEYKGKGYFTGKSHQIKATVTPLPVVEGPWHERSKFTKGPHLSSSAGDFHYVVSKSKEIITAVGGEKDGSQGEYETRKLWNLVAKGIREGDYELAARDKSRIENEQRQMRKDEVAEERKWQLKHFKKHESDPIYEKLGKLAKLTPPEEDYYEFLVNWPESLAS